MSETFSTADLSDGAAGAHACEPGLHDYGRRASFYGPISTVEAPADNTLVRAALEEPGNGRVLVVEGHAGKSCALLGDMLGLLAQKNGWAGVIVHGYVRDTLVLADLAIGVKALGTHPKKSDKQGRGARDVPVRFLGVSFQPGHFVYADADGVLVSETKLYP